MLTIEDAFKKFKSRLELNEKEEENASARHTEVREHMDKKFNSRSFLTGSYARWTKTKPLKDIDIFFELKESEKDYRKKDPSVILDAFYNHLAAKYTDKAVKKDGRCVTVDFGTVVDEDDNTNYKVVSIDAVPAFPCDGNYEIPDEDLGIWIKTNPDVHKEKAIAAHQAYSSEWKGIVRMLKYWNNNKKHGDERPINPSFLIEVMALDCLYGGWQGQFDREMQSIFPTFADRIFEDWPDPAGLGPPVSDGMDRAQKQRAKELLLEAGKEANAAIDHVRKGRNVEALKAWRELFGPKFPLS